MVGGKIEITRFHQVIADAPHDLGVVTISEFGNEDADGQRAPATKRARQKTRLIVELLGRQFNALARRLRNRPAGNFVENNRDGRGIQSQVFGQLS